MKHVKARKHSNAKRSKVKKAKKAKQAEQTRHTNNSKEQSGQPEQRSKQVHDKARLSMTQQCNGKAMRGETKRQGKRGEAENMKGKQGMATQWQASETRHGKAKPRPSKV